MERGRRVPFFFLVWLLRSHAIEIWQLASNPRAGMWAFCNWLAPPVQPVYWKIMHYTPVLMSIVNCFHSAPSACMTLFMVWYVKSLPWGAYNKKCSTRVRDKRVCVCDFLSCNGQNAVTVKFQGCWRSCLFFHRKVWKKDLVFWVEVRGGGKWISRVALLIIRGSVEEIMSFVTIAIPEFAILQHAYVSCRMEMEP